MWFDAEAGIGMTSTHMAIAAMNRNDLNIRVASPRPSGAGFGILRV
jgi:hypothetical protein